MTRVQETQARVRHTLAGQRRRTTSIEGGSQGERVLKRSSPGGTGARREGHARDQRAFEEACLHLARCSTRDEIGIAVDPDRVAPERRAILGHFLRVEDRSIWYVDVPDQTRIQVESRMPVFRRSSEIAR